MPADGTRSWRQGLMITSVSRTVPRRFSSAWRHLGGCYQYAEATATAEGDGGGELTREDLAALPMGLRRDLGEAVTSLDAARISAAIDRVATENPALGLTLRRIAERFAYSAILNAIQVSGVRSW